MTSGPTKRQPSFSPDLPDLELKQLVTHKRQWAGTHVTKICPKTNLLSPAKGPGKGCPCETGH